MKNVLIWLAKACVSGIIAIGVLSLFALFYFYTGVHRPNPSGATDFLWEPNQLVVDRREGNANLRLDANGFNNYNYESGRAVDFLLMGDSNMEAAHVPASENTGALLNSLLSDKYTYLIALGGHNIYTCVKNIDAALREFEPKSCVLIDINSVALDVSSMQQVLTDEYPTAVSYDHGLLASLQKWVPGVKLIYKQLEDWVGLESAEDDLTAPANSEGVSQTDYGSVLDLFLAKAAAPAKERDIELVIFYIPAVDICEDGTPSVQTDPDQLSLFEQACERNGFCFIDMTDAFMELYNEQHKLPYGFPNTRVGKGHMNRYGYEVVAEELAEVLATFD